VCMWSINTVFMLQPVSMEFWVAVNLILFITEGWQQCNSLKSPQQNNRPHIVFIMADDLVKYQNSIVRADKICTFFLKCMMI
jgi:hypothetical protein